MFWTSSTSSRSLHISPAIQRTREKPFRELFLTLKFLPLTARRHPSFSRRIPPCGFHSILWPPIAAHGPGALNIDMGTVIYFGHSRSHLISFCFAFLARFSYGCTSSQLLQLGYEGSNPLLRLSASKYCEEMSFIATPSSLGFHVEYS